MEVGFIGEDIPGQPSFNKTDLLTTVLHEMGHSLGINYAWGEDYDILQQFISMHDNTDIVAIDDHLADDRSVMFATVAPGTRRLISATDVFALADDEGYETVRLQRVDLLGILPGLPQVWDVPWSWEGGSVPTEGTDVSVRGFVYQQGIADAGDLRIRGGGEVHLLESDLVVHRLLATEEVGGLLSGFGHLTTASLFHDGIVRAQDGGSGLPLVIEVLGSCDLDGTEVAAGTTDPSLLDATFGDLTILPATGVADKFRGLATVGAGRTFTVGSDLIVGNEGVIELIGKLADPATIAVDGLLELVGTAVVTVEGPGVIDASVAFFGGSAFLTSGAQLDLLGDTSFEGFSTSSSQAGTLRQMGDLTVQSTNNVVDVERYDWDGDGDTVTTVSPFATYEISAMAVADDASGFHGAVNNGGTLTVDVGPAKAPEMWVIGKGGRLSQERDSAAPEVWGSDILLRDEGLLDGDGLLFVNVYNESGIVSPRRGKDVGTLEIGRGLDYYQVKGAVLAIDFDAKGNSDRLAVGATAHLGGTLILTGPLPTDKTTYTIVTAETVTGEFDIKKLPGTGTWTLGKSMIGTLQAMTLTYEP